MKCDDGSSVVELSQIVVDGFNHLFFDDIKAIVS